MVSNKRTKKQRSKQTNKQKNNSPQNVPKFWSSPPFWLWFWAQTKKTRKPGKTPLLSPLTKTEKNHPDLSTRGCYELGKEGWPQLYMIGTPLVLMDALVAPNPGFHQNDRFFQLQIFGTVMLQGASLSGEHQSAKKI